MPEAGWSSIPLAAGEQEVLPLSALVGAGFSPRVREKARSIRKRGRLLGLRRHFVSRNFGLEARFGIDGGFPVLGNGVGHIDSFHRKIDLDRGAVAFLAVDAHMTARFCGETIDHRQPKTRALAGGLGREEGLEDLVEERFRNSRALIGDGDDDVPAGAHIGIGRDIVVIELDDASFDCELAAAAHGIAAIDGEVDERSLKLGRVGFDEGVFRRQHQLQFHRLADRAADEREHVPDEVIDPHLFRLHSLLAREAQQLPRQLGTLFRRLGGFQQPLAGLAVAVDGMFDQIEIAQNDSQQVVEVMRVAAETTVA